MIKHNGEYYGWNAVYLISGLVQEDFLHDSVGSWEQFIECLGKWEKPKQQFSWNDWYADRDIYGNED